ncbi:hypothetical protein BpHYR1_040345, partial [Brachionus plicatilis]
WDLVYGYDFDEVLSVKGKIKNLGDQKISYSRDGKETESYYNYLAVAIMAATLVGCGGDSDDDNGNNAGKSYEVDCNADNSRCFVSGTINENFTMTADRKWVLDGSVFVGSGEVEITSAAQEQAIKDAGVTLTVEAGADIRGL